MQGTGGENLLGRCWPVPTLPIVAGFNLPGDTLHRHFPFAGSEVAILLILSPRIKANGHADGNASV